MKKLKILIVLVAIFMGGGNVAWADTYKTVYFAPNMWDAGDTERYSVYMYNGSDDPAWASFTEGTGGIWSVQFNEKYDHMILCRMNDNTGSVKENRWNTNEENNNNDSNRPVFNQTEDLDAPYGDNLLYTIRSWNGGTDGKSNVNISPYELKDGGTFYLYNVGAQKYLCSGNSWGSHASVDVGGIPVSIVASNGLFKITTDNLYTGRYVHKSADKDNNNNDVFNHDVFMDSGDFTEWTFERVDNNIYKIKTGSLNGIVSLCFDNAENSTFVFAETNPTENNARWMLYTEAQRIAALSEAPKYSSKNATFLIKNYYFARGDVMAVNKDVEDLSSSPSWKGTRFSNIGGNHTWEGNASYAALQKEKTFDNYQELTSIPNGKYHLTAKALYTTKTNYEAVPYIYATTNGNTVSCNAKPKGEEVTGADDDALLSSAAQALMGNTYLLDGVDVVVSNNTLRVGIKSDANADWCAFDDFSLMYLGPIVKEDAIALPDGGAMAADTWYYVDVAETGILGFNATNIGSIVYTTDGNAFGGDVVTTLPCNLLKSDNTTNRYYVKSSINNNLQVGKVCDNYTYWFFRSSDHKYMSRGGAWGTQAIADEYGLPVRVAFEDNYINFVFVDTWRYLFDADNGNVYTDAVVETPYRHFAIVPTDGGYYILNQNRTSTSTYEYKLTIDGSTLSMSNDNATATVWIMESVASNDHKNQMQEVKDAQAKTVAMDVGITEVTSQELFNNYLNSNYTQQSITITGTSDIIGNKTQDAAETNPAVLDLFPQETVNKLANGLYKLTVKGFERITTNDITYDLAGGSTGLSYLYANDEKVQLYSVFDYPSDTQWDSGDVIKGGKYYPNNTTGAQAAFDDDKYINEVFVWVTNGTLNFGIRNNHRYVATGKQQWVCYNNFELTYYAPKSEIMDETTTYTPTAKYANVSLTRNFTNQWNSFVIPFDIDNATLKEKFGNDVIVAEATELNTNSIKFTPMNDAEKSITANKPVIMKGFSESSPYTFNNVLIKTGSTTISNNGTSFVGNYEAGKRLTPAEGQDWYYVKGIDLKKSDGSQTINAFRAYITTTASSSPGRLSMTVDGEEQQGIDALVNTLADGKLYNLQGQRVNAVQKGLFIKDGKKVVIK